MRLGYAGGSLLGVSMPYAWGGAGWPPGSSGCREGAVCLVAAGEILRLHPPAPPPPPGLQFLPPAWWVRAEKGDLRFGE